MIGRLEHEIAKAAQQDWRAGAFLLSKRMREVYGSDKQRVELTEAGGKPVGFRPLSPEVAEEIRHKILFGDYEPWPPAWGPRPSEFPEDP